MLDGEDARVVAVAPGDLVGVVTDWCHGHRRQRDQLIGFQDAEGIGRLEALFAAAGTRAIIAQMLPAIEAAMAVPPLDHQAVAPLFAQGHRLDCFRLQSRHGSCSDRRPYCLRLYYKKIDVEGMAAKAAERLVDAGCMSPPIPPDGGRASGNVRS